MANESIKVSFSSINDGITKLGEITNSLSTCSSTLSSAWNKLDVRVRNKLGSNYDTSKIDDIKKKLEEVNTFLGIVLTTYQSADLDLNSYLSVEQLAAIYPGFSELSDERKAIVLSALRYLGLNGAQVMSYGSNFSSEFVNKQFRGDAINHAWCAMFVGSMISYFFGESGNIINPSYASVWKIIGNYGNQIGIAFNPDDRVHYYVSQACINLYNSGNPDYQYSSWQRYVDSFNASHGTNIKVSDWVDESFVPEAGDIIVFSSNNRDSSSKHYYPNDTLANSHIGFVLGTRTVNGVLYIDTVEGNVRNDVEVRSFRADDPYLTGFGHIDYDRFYSDQTAVQKTISQGVDVNASGARVGLLTSGLREFSYSSANAKEAYLVNLANNLGNDSGAIVGATHIPAKVTEEAKVVTTSQKTTDTSEATTQTVATTPTSTPINTSSTTVHTTSTSTYSTTPSTSTHSSYNYVSAPTSTTITTSTPVQETSTTQETKVPEIHVEETSHENKTSPVSWSDIYKEKDKYVEKFVPHKSEETNSLPGSSGDVPIKEEPSAEPVKESVPESVVEPTKVDTPSVKEPVSSQPSVKPTEVREYQDEAEEVDNYVPIEEPVVTEESIKAEETITPEAKVDEPAIDNVPADDDAPYIPTEDDYNYDYDLDYQEGKYDYPNQFNDKPSSVSSEKENNTTPTVEESDIEVKKNNKWIGTAVGLGIATGGAAIVYTVNRNKKKRTEEEE